MFRGLVDLLVLVDGEDFRLAILGGLVGFGEGDLSDESFSGGALVSSVSGSRSDSLFIASNCSIRLVRLRSSGCPVSRSRASSTFVPFGADEGSLFAGSGLINLKGKR